MRRALAITAMLASACSEPREPLPPPAALRRQIELLDLRVCRLARQAAAGDRVRRATMALGTSTTSNERRAARVSWVFAQAELQAAFSPEGPP